METKTIARKSLNDVVEVFNKIKSAGKSFVVLAGAGCSVKSGIPDAQMTSAIIKNKFPKAFEKATAKDYHHLIAALSAREKDLILAKYYSDPKINWASIAIALLIKKQFASRVFTTNFDSLLIRACALMDEYPAVYDGTTSKLSPQNISSSSSLVYLHGQDIGKTGLHTSQGFAVLQDSLAALVQNTAKENPWIVMGYKGANDPVFKLLAQVEKFEKGLYWVGTNDNEIPSHVKEHLLEKNNGAYYVNGADADSFLVGLTQKLGIFPPDFISKPYSHFGEKICSIAPFPLPGRAGELNVTQTFQDDLQYAIKEFEGTDGKTNVGKDGSSLARPDSDQIKAIFTAQQHLLAGEPDKVLKFRDEYDKNPSPVMADLLYWASVMQGNVLRDQVKQAKDKQKSRLLQQAAEKYQAANEIKPDKAETLFQWAMVLKESTIGETEKNIEKHLVLAGEKLENAIELKPNWYEAHQALGQIHFQRGESPTEETAENHFNQAIKYFKSALSIREDLPEALYGLGKAMVHQARWKQGGEAVQLFDQSMKKFRETLSYQPRHFNALTSWGDVLTHLAENMEDEEANSLLADAQDKYKSAIKINPKNHTGFLGWGKVLWMRGGIGSDQGAEALYAQAIEKFQSALHHNPNIPAGLCGWGNVLVTLGSRKKGQEAFQLMTQAMEKFRSALAIQSDNIEALAAWANALYLHAEKMGEKEAEKIYLQSAEKYQAVLNIDPNYAEAFNNWGNIFLRLTEIRKDQEQSLLERAAEKFQAALSCQPDYAEALINWGTVLFRLAQTKDSEQAGELYKQAEERYQSALSIQPNYPEAYNNLGWILIQKAKRLIGKEADATYKQAGDVFKAAIEIRQDMHEAHFNWGTALMEQAKTKKGINVHPFLINAKKKLQNAESLAPGTGSYQLARLMALLANETGCKEWLEKAKDQGSLPARDVWMNETDFASVRESKWFKSLVPEENRPKAEEPAKIIEPEEIVITDDDLELEGAKSKI